MNFQSNPLAEFMRQPKIYIRLPSEGKFWPDGSLKHTENGEYPVYSMTAKDELLLKIPDALMNGQAVVDVIQNCVPNIKDAWKMPSIDVDLVLIAIRLATYGEKMKTPITLQNDIEFEYHIDLRQVMDALMNNITWNETVPINENLTIFVRPLTYKSITEAAIRTFETQKIIQLANNDQMPEEEKIKLFRDSFKKLTEVTVGTIKSSIYKVDSIHGSTDNLEFIREFIENSDKEIFNKVQNHLEELRLKNQLKPISIPVTEDLKAQGVTTDTIEIPLTFDPSTFFE